VVPNRGASHVEDEGHKPDRTSYETDIRQRGHIIIARNGGRLYAYGYDVVCCGARRQPVIASCGVHASVTRMITHMQGVECGGGLTVPNMMRREDKMLREWRRRNMRCCFANHVATVTNGNAIQRSTPCTKPVRYVNGTRRRRQRHNGTANQVVAGVGSYAMAKARRQRVTRDAGGGRRASIQGVCAMSCMTTRRGRRRAGVSRPAVRQCRVYKPLREALSQNDPARLLSTQIFCCATPARMPARPSA